MSFVNPRIKLWRAILFEDSRFSAMVCEFESGACAVNWRRAGIQKDGETIEECAGGMIFCASRADVRKLWPGKRLELALQTEIDPDWLPSFPHELTTRDPFEYGDDVAVEDRR